jgi:hypothetical protein
LDEQAPGGVIAKVMIASDKTKLTTFRGNKEAWPVYLTLGNIAKSYRRKPSNHATVLVGYLPSPKLDIFTREDRRRREQHALFHRCMRKVFAPLVAAGLNGTESVCPDGRVRRVFPILGSYIADYPEQCLVCCCIQGRCPSCTTPLEDIGEGKVAPYRDPQETLRALLQAKDGVAPEYFDRDGIRPTYNPFWAELPHCNIFRCMTPDIMHELHKFWWDHARRWTSKMLGQRKLDDHYKALASFPGLQRFKNGISGLSLTTMKEHKQMQKSIVAVVASSSNVRLVSFTRGIIDFIYLAQLQAHTARGTLSRGLKEALALVHDNKAVFIESGARVSNHWRIPKLEKMTHYMASILEHGSADGTNSENMERLHIDFCHAAYQGGNGQDHLEQMTVWMRRRDALARRAAYLAWVLAKAEDSMDTDTEDEELVEEVAFADGGAFRRPTQQGEAGAGDEDDGDEEEVDDPDDAERKFFIARKCPFPRTSATTLREQHGASQFLPALEAFLAKHMPNCEMTPYESDLFDVYNQVRVRAPQNPYFPGQPPLEAIRARRTIPAHGRIAEKAGCFDPALVCAPPGGEQVARLYRESHESRRVLCNGR